MQFSELGAPDKQAIVMLPPMMCSNAVHLPVAQLLAQDFRVVLPTYDGHCLDGSRYTSKLDQCAKIRSYLDDQGIEDVALVQGSSMGAEIALELLHERPQIRNGFFDGGPFFHFPGFVRHRFDKVFMKIVDKASGFPSEEAAIRGFAASDKLRSKLPTQDQAAEGVDVNEIVRAFLEDFVPIARSMDWDTVERLGETCYAGDLPAMGGDIQRRMTFYYGKETAAKSRKRVRKAYPHARYLEGTMGHCTFELTHPQEYAQMLIEACR